MSFPLGSLVLYKTRVARVLSSAEKIEIEVLGGGKEKVRPKDIALLHPGPYRDASQLAQGPMQFTHPPEELSDLWELLEGEDTTLEDLSNMLFGGFGVSDAYWMWQYVQETPYFEGTPDKLSPRSSEALAKIRRDALDKLAQGEREKEFLERLRSGTYLPEDKTRLLELENLALGRTSKSKLMVTLGQSETPEAAHALLLRIGLWDFSRNPYPSRMGVVLSPPALEVPAFPEEVRLDLTHLESYAIDDEGAGDPDDAISLETLENGEFRLWIHVSDVAALVTPDSPLDHEARKRGATLYTPERIVTMLPEDSVGVLGLGLEPISNALSIGIALEGPDFVPGEVQIQLSRVRVTRTTYAGVSGRLTEEPFRQMLEIARRLEARRVEDGAVQLELPEVKIKAVNGQVSIKPIGFESARPIVQESMMLAGWAAATYALEREIPFPFARQDVFEQFAPLTGDGPAQDLPEMFARRKSLGRTQWNVRPGRHMGLGLEPYAQVTSPMRRYLDLVAHQQLRAHLAEEQDSEPSVQGVQGVLGASAVLERIGASDLASSSVRQAERVSNRHWTLVYLQQNPGWQGRGVVVDQRGAGNTVLIPDLALEVSIGGTLELGQELALEAVSVDLAALEVRFRVSGA